MTKINKLVMHGFKSFAKRTELVFGEKFNCVVGPNGSGKSNILDALCFVLGKSSAKALRTEKASNLIYNGGKDKKPASHAEVSLYFDNTKKVFPTDEEEVKISRIVRPNGNSIYKINDETRTRFQVLELLSIANINPEGYNIILQGDITRFVSMPTEERRLLVEQISGISVYEEKKQKAINELNKVDEKLKEAGIILAERETQLKELKKERDQATKYNEMSHSIKVNKASLLHKTLKRKNQEHEELDDKNKKTKEKLDKKTDEMLAVKNKIKEGRNSIDTINKEIESRGEKEQVDIHKEVEKLKVSIASSKNRIESVKNEINKIQARKKQLEENKQDILAKIKKLEDEKNDYSSQIKAKEAEHKQIDEKIASFKKKHNLEDAAEIEKKVDELDKQAEKKQREITELRQKQQDALREKDKLEFQIQSLDEKIVKVLEVEKENKAQVEDLKQKKVEFKKATTELSKKISDDSSLAAQLGNARTSLIGFNETLAKMNARNIAQQEALEADAGLKGILSQKKKMPGVYGTISELGQVSSKYATALEIAAGNKIKSVVVADDKVASDCINYLKESKLGVVTFLPLNKMKSPGANPNVAQALKTQGVQGLAIELVKFDPRYKQAFQYVFGETLVVDTIEVARRVGVGKVKMVTLDGDLAEFSGAMQGGFRHGKARGFGFKEQELTKDIEGYEKRIQDTELLVARLEKERKKNEEEIAQLREFKAHLEGDIIKLEKVLHLDTADLEANKKVKKDFQDSLKDVEKQTAKIEQDISDMNKGLADNRVQRQQLRQKVNDLRNPRLLAELNAFDEKLKQLKEEIIRKQGEMKNSESQITNILLPEVKNIEKIVKQHEKEEGDFNGEIKSTHKLIEEMEFDLKKKEKQQEQFHLQFKDLFNQRGKIDETIKKWEVQVEELSEDHRKVELQINTFSLELAKVKAEIAGIEHEYKAYEGIEVVENKAEEQLRKEIGIWEGIITRMGNINMKALETYEMIEKEYSGLLGKKEKLVREKEDVLLIMNDIETKKKDLFMKTFEVVNANFKTIFSALSSKGEASLVLENQNNPFEGGVMVKVRLTGKRFMDIRSLSGGEKTMTALAFIFSIQEHEPASFYILDEVDAALDKKNSERLGQLIRKYTENAQYVVISHNDSLVSEADLLYGVAMDEHDTSTVTSLKV